MNDKHSITVVGIGPGSEDYILPAARYAIEQAKILVGGKRALASFAHAGQKTMAIGGNLQGVFAYIQDALQENDVCVMVSGDPGYYSMLDALRQKFPIEVLRVIPGISSLSFAFAKLALPWHNARLLSFHGRVPDDSALHYERGAILGMLTDGISTSHTIPERLIKSGWSKSAKLHILSRLSYEDEAIVHTELGRAGELPEVKHGILIVEDGEA